MMTTTQKILLIAANQDETRLWQSLLAEAGDFELICARRLADGQAQLQAAKGTIGLILLDLDLPDSRGPETLHCLRKITTGAAVVVLTAGHDAALMDRLVAAGAQDYLVKSEIDAAGLARSLRYALERRRLELRLEQQAAAMQKLDRARTQQRQAEAQIKFQAHLLDTVGQAVIATDLGGRITYWNRFAEQLYGYSKAEALGLNSVDLTVPDSARSQALDIMARLSSGQSWSGEFLVRHRDGHTFTALISDAPVFDDQGCLVGIVGVSTDIKRQKQTEARLLALSGLGRWLFDAQTPADAARIIAAVTEDLLGWDSYALDLYLPESDQMLDVINVDLIDGHRAELPPEKARPVSSLARRIMTEGGQLLLRRHRDDFADQLSPFGAVERRSESLLFAPIRHGQRISGILTIQSYSANAYTPADLDLLQSLADHCGGALERIRAQTALCQSEKRFRALIENGSDAVALLDAQGVLLYQSPVAQRIIGYDETEMVGKNAFELLHPDDLPEAQSKLEELIQSPGRRASQEFRYRHKDGHWLWLEGNSVNMLDEPAVGALVVHYRDISRRKEAEKSARQANQRAIKEYELLLDRLTLLAQKVGTAADLNTVYHALLKFAQVSAPCDGMFVSAYDPQRQERTCVYAWSPAGPEDVSLLPAMPMTNSPHSRAVATGKIIVSNNLPDDLAGQPFVDLGHEVDPTEPQSALVVPMIILGRVIGGLEIQTKQPAAYSEEHVTAMRMAGNLAAIATENVRLLQREREARRATEASEERFQAQAEQVRQIIDTVSEGLILLTDDYHILEANPASLLYLARLLDEAAGHPAVLSGQKPLRRLAGQPIEQLLSAPPPGQIHHELVIETGNRAGPETFELAAQPITAGPRRNGWVLIVRNVTQERQLQLHIQHQERLAAVGQLAAGIAHDFNNIMSVIVLYAQMVRQARNLPEKDGQRLNVIYRQAIHATNLIHQILDFSRRSVMARHPIDLLPFIKELIKLWQRTFPENIQLRLQHQGDDYVVNADPTRLQQMLMNLAFNARDAMPDGGVLTLSLARLALADGENPPLPEMTPGEWLWLVVSDTGVGVPPDHMAHLFEPFFTTKAPGRGTGLGLPQVYGIVKQHDGHITVDSRTPTAADPESGTHFTIYLPLLPAAKPNITIPEISIVADGVGTILVVEDDAATRAALQDIIEALGYRVLVAADGREALAIHSEHPGPIDLVISDLMMPRLGGVELYRQLKEKQPRIKMIVITGYPLANDGRELLEQGVLAWLQKPFDADEIALKIRMALEAEK